MFISLVHWDSAENSGLKKTHGYSLTIPRVKQRYQVVIWKCMVVCSQQSDIDSDEIWLREVLMKQQQLYQLAIK